MKYKVVQGFLIQYIDNEDKILKTKFIPGDKFILDCEKSSIDTGNNKICFDDDKELAKIDIMPYGKWKGIKIVDLELGYLQWGVENISDKHMVEVFKEELERRNKIGLDIQDKIPF